MRTIFTAILIMFSMSGFCTGEIAVKKRVKNNFWSLKKMIQNQDTQVFKTTLASIEVESLNEKTKESILKRIIRSNSNDMLHAYIDSLDHWLNKDLLINGLHTCFYKQNKEMMKTMLSRTAVGAVPCESLEVLLETAVRKKQLEMAEILLNFGTRLKKFNPSKIRDVETAYLFGAELYEFRTKRGENALFVFNKPEIVEYLLVSGLDPNSTDSREISVLMKTWNVEKARLLISFGADVNKKGPRDKTPLMFARKRALAELLLDYGAEINAKDKQGRTALMLAKDIDLIRLLLEHGADPLLKDAYGLNALDTALMKGAEILELFLEFTEVPDGVDSFVSPQVLPETDIQVVDTLINMGLDINVRNQHGKNAAFYATDLETVQDLEAFGLNLNITDNYGRTPIFYQLPQDVLEYYLNSGISASKTDQDGRNPLFFATSPEALELLILKGADVSRKDKDGETPLFKLVRNVYRKKGAGENTEKMIVMLLFRGADINALNRKKQTPLMVSPSLELNEFLTMRGAQAAPGKKVKSINLIKLVRRKNSLEGIKKLIEQGKNIWAKWKGQSLLMFCRPEYTQFFIDAGLPLEYTTETGNTVLMQSIAYDWSGKKIRILIKNGARADARNNEGETALHLAIQIANVRAVKELVKIKEILSLRNYNGWTALGSGKRLRNKLLEQLTTDLKPKVKKNTQKKLKRLEQCIKTLEKLNIIE